MTDTLDSLLRTTGMWRASSIDHAAKSGIASGYPELDRKLPGAGWPGEGITELLHERTGIGELRLVTPALAHLSQEQERWIVWVAPPFIPYAPALTAEGFDLSNLLLVNPENEADKLWAIEKALLSRSCSAVLAWPEMIRNQDIRRLQLAAREGKCWNILFRPMKRAQHASPADLRIKVMPDLSPSLRESSSVQVSIIKRRGGWATDFFSVDLKDSLQRTRLKFSELIVPVTTATKNRGANVAETESMEVSTYGQPSHEWNERLQQGF